MRYDKPTIMKFDRPTVTQIHDFEWLKTFNSQYLNAPSTDLLHFCAVEFLSLGATIMFIWMFIILLYWCVYSMCSFAWIKMKFDDWTLKISVLTFGLDLNSMNFLLKNSRAFLVNYIINFRFYRFRKNFEKKLFEILLLNFR